VTARRDVATARWDLDDVLARTDLASLLDEVTQPSSSGARGRRWHCPIPQHDDVHPSVTILTDRSGHQRWRCWSGDDTHRGDAIDLVKATQGLPTGQAIDLLARRAGMVPGVELPPATRRRAAAVPRDVPLNPAVDRHYVSRCERILWGPDGREVLAYLHGRGFSDEILRANRAGADPGRDHMFRAKGLPHGDSPAAVMPALAPDGSLAYVQARYLEPAEGVKYDNPARSMGTNPRLAWTRTIGEPEPGPLVVCEGIPDAWSAAQAGSASVAILGNQAPDASVARRIAAVAADQGRDLVAVIDNDDGGRVWRDNLTGLLADEGHSLTVIEPPAPGLDLNAWSLRDPDWAAAIATAGVDPIAL
jgi:DNA primase